MSKYKVGDVVRRTGEDCANVRKGMTYTVSGLSDAGDTLYLGFGDKGYCSYNFELVQDESEYLIPEQVFKALQDKQELQYMYEYTTGTGDYVVGWRDCSNPQFANILNRNWRIKPVPKTIDYYGTELPKPIDISKLDGSTVVYVPQLHRGTVNPITVARAKKYHFYKNALHFSTESDAKLVIDTLLKPFKQ